MTLTALNIASIVFTVVLVCVLVVVYVRLRRAMADAEGAIDVVQLEDPAPGEWFS